MSEEYPVTCPESVKAWIEIYKNTTTDRDEFQRFKFFVLFLTIWTVLLTMLWQGLKSPATFLMIVGLMPLPIMFSHEIYKDLNFVKKRIKKREFYRDKIKNSNYAAELSQIFDLECSITKKEIKMKEYEILSSLEHKKCIKGDILLDLIDSIEFLKKDNQQKIELEVQSRKNESVGKIINELKNL